jgi:hypothetical protein
MSDEARINKSPKEPNIEGEGSYEAAKRYKKSVDNYLADNDPEKAAEQAKRALNTEEASELEKAEQAGKKPARH